jgi:hypothetical protein
MFLPKAGHTPYKGDMLQELFVLESLALSFSHLYGYNLNLGKQVAKLILNIISASQLSNLKFEASPSL